jgi:hypothetical protein
MPGGTVRAAVFTRICDNHDVTFVFRLAGVQHHPLDFSGDSGSARIFNIHSFINQRRGKQLEVAFFKTATIAVFELLLPPLLSCLVA